jgi:hypothetical protein
MIGWMIGHAGQILAHCLLGAMFTATGFFVRSSCSHRGWLPHPKQQVLLTGGLVFIEACATVPLVG